MNMNITKTDRKSIMADLKEFDYLSKEGDFVEVTEWVNGEGVDIAFQDKIISLSFGELKGINTLVNLL